MMNQIWGSIWSRVAVLLVSMVLLFLCLFWHDVKTHQELISDKGSLSLRNLDLQSDEVTNLGGEWSFYWNRLVDQRQLPTAGDPDAYVSIPKVWNDYVIKSGKTTGQGYATFVLRVTDAKPGEAISFRISPMSTAYRFYIDGKLLADNGVVGTDRQSSQSEYRVTTATITPQTSTFTILIQVSNYEYARGGIWYSIQMGSEAAIQGLNNGILYKDLFLCSSFILMIVYNLAVFTFRTKERSNLYFTFMCIAALGRVLIYGSYQIHEIPALSGISAIVRIDYLSVIWFIGFFILLTDIQFEKCIPKVVMRVYFIIAGIYTLIVVVIPFLWVTNTTYFMQGLCIIMGLYVFQVVLKQYLKKEKNSYMLLLATTAVIYTGIHDVLMQNNYLHEGAVELFPIAFFVFLLTEGVIIARKYSDSLLENERNLIQINAIEQEQHEMEMKFLKSQIKPHFVHNTLNAIISLSRTDPERSRQLLLNFSAYLRNCFDFDNLEDLVSLEKEVQFVGSYIYIEKARFEDSFKVIFDIDESLRGRLDTVMVPPLVLQPLVENALKHGIRDLDKPGEIRIFIENQEASVLVGVQDNGVGFPLERLAGVFPQTRKGVGIVNINSRLNKLFGEGLHIENVATGGTRIYMIIPRGKTNESNNSR